MDERYRQQLTKIIRKCRDDAVLFCNTFLWDRENQKPFEPNYAQKQFMDPPYDAKTTWVCVHRRAGKPQPLDALVLTIDGWKPMGDVQVGDYVVTPEGKKARVSKLHPVENPQPIYRITFDDGTSAESTLDHVWRFTILNPSTLKYKSVDMTLEEWWEYKSKFRNPLFHPFLQSNQLKTNLKELTYPYSRGVLFSTEDLLFIEPQQLQPIMEAISETKSDIKIETSVAGPRLLNRAVRFTKNFQNNVLLSDVASRINFLQGVLDCAGILTSSKLYEIKVYLRDPDKRELFSNVVRSLGGKAIIKGRNVFILLPKSIEPFKVSPLKYKYTAPNEEFLKRGVVSIELVREELVQCITVKDKNHLYFTDNLTPTHNCVDGTSQIIDADTNERIAIADAINIKSTYVFDFKKNQLVKSKCKWIKHSTKKPFLRIDLGIPYPLYVSEDHMLFTKHRGWVEAQYLDPMDEILAPNSTPEFPGESTLKEEIVDKIHTIYPNTATLVTTTDIDEAGKIFNKLTSKGVYPVLNDLNNLVVLPQHEQVLIKQEIDIDIETYEAPSPRRWLKIHSVVSAGERTCYDLEVEHEDHNFVCNNVIVHNSIGLAAIALWKAFCNPNYEVWIYSGSDMQIDNLFSYMKGFLNVTPDDDFKQTYFSAILKHSVIVNTKTPYTIGLNNGSIIHGVPLGLNEKNPNREGKRGSTAQVVIVDEAQELPDDAWRVIKPVMSGGQYWRKVVRNFVAGTIVDPSTVFYKTVYSKPKKREKIVLVPADKNPELTPEMLEEFREECDSESIWKTEYLLLPATQEKSVFNQDDIYEACKEDYQYSPKLVNPQFIRFLSVDWDKAAAGTSIMINQWDPYQDHCKVIYRHETEFGSHFIPACNLILELIKEYNVNYIFADQGNGEMQWEYLVLESYRRDLGLEDKIYKIAFNQKFKVPNIQETATLFAPDQEEEDFVKKEAKDLMVGITQNYFHNKRIKFPEGDEKLKDQLFQYQVIRVRDDGTRVFSKENEHSVDTLCLTLLGVYSYKTGEISELDLDHLNIELFGEISDDYDGEDGDDEDFGGSFRTII